MYPRFLVFLIMLFSLSRLASPAQAGGVVTICDETHLKTALAGGGTVTFACSGTITLTSAIVISVDSTIDGIGQSVILNGNNEVKVFKVNNGNTLTLKSLTIVDGFSPLGEEGGGGIYNHGTVVVNNSSFLSNHARDRGGGIYNAGVLTIRNSTFSYNTATWGASIYNSDLGTLTVSNSTFSSNEVLEVGGSILNDGNLTVNNSTFTDNRAPGDGGGISNSGTLTVINSTFSGNIGVWHGGGISTAGTLSVKNSTFSNNGATLGGGIANVFGTVKVSNSTFYANRSDNGGGIYNELGSITIRNSTLSANSASEAGGGIYNDDGTINLGNTIIANSPTGGNCTGAIVDDGGNLTFGDSTCPGTPGDPLLGPLQDNGGFTYTMALGPASPAIDTAVTAICAAPPVNNLDQRGLLRPVDGDNDGYAACDIGSFEYQTGVSTDRLYLPSVFIN